MNTETKRLYEAMFLVDTTDAAGNWEGVTNLITGIIEKRGGVIESLKKWDERKLCYEIKKLSRGTYILVYFNAEPSSITAIERDVKLTEDIIRVMILRADFMGEDDLQKETPLEREARLEKEEAQAAKEEARKSEQNYDGDDDDYIDDDDDSDDQDKD
ncbi:30S ribosomal protein S6 [Limihaloglobus sulfuriphilus]|uniref:Small ribosomal subunit protein bS6 n=1 Tax=Limihaloglobus sulfuriphilus TaxID=1851148 RepID=A0A1Q2MBL7_9BACT|nr:30S ribosomal protein S6 [Limihaloglobus sulfuriphilus]AQQ70096.1 30S ribosomal protein S6 [Limihaloglobus sulfuriphilus]